MNKQLEPGSVDLTGVENRSSRPPAPVTGQVMPPDPGPSGPEARAIMARHGLGETVSDALARKGFSPGEALETWLAPRLSQLTRPDEMADRAAAADRIARAIRAGERIAVFGDYDCDGITSTAIMTSAIRALGGEVAPLLATRTEGAYGLSDPAAARVAASCIQWLS